MAYSLKTTGLATLLTMCVAVDEDGTTIREFVNTTVDSQKTVDSGVTTASKSWKGTSRYYFSTAANGSYDFYGIRFGTTKPPWQPVDADGCTFWAACASISPGDGSTPGIFLSDDSNHNIRRLTDGTGALALYSYSGDRAAGTTALPTGGASFSVGIAYDNADYAAYFGLESGSLASDGSGTSNAGFMGNTSVASVGGFVGIGNCPASWHIICLFDRKLTLTELQSLHDDWFNVLFDAAGAPTIEQEGFRFGADDGSESAHTWLAAQDTNVTQPLDQRILLDMLVNASGAVGAKKYKLQYRRVGEDTWQDMPII